MVVLFIFCLFILQTLLYTDSEKLDDIIGQVSSSHRSGIKFSSMAFFMDILHQPEACDKVIPSPRTYSSYARKY